MKNFETRNNSGKYFICYDSFEEEIYLSEKKNNKSEYYLWEPKINVLNKFPNISGRNLPDKIEFLTCHETQSYPFLDMVEVKKWDDVINLQITLSFTWSFWKSPIKMDVFLMHLSSLLVEIPNIEFQTDISQWEMTCLIHGKFTIDTEVKICEKIEKLGLIISQFHKKLEHRLINSFSQNVLINTFNFPEEYKNICNQYLMYFGEFLNDIGLHSKLSIESKDNSVILTVQPENNDEPIENIENALATYLVLPSTNPLENITSKEDPVANIKYQQLLAVVDHLKSQLRLQEALISAKEHHIKSLEENNKNISNMNSLLLNSYKNSSSVKDKKYSILGGNIELTEYKGAFFKINIPKGIEYISKMGKSKKK